VRGTHAFNSPELLQGFVDFLREKGSAMEAVAAGLVVPKSMVAYPQVRTGFGLSRSTGTSTKAYFVLPEAEE
jgi:hypothetical protein